MIHVTQDVQ